MILSDSLVIIPTYKERENVVRMLETVMGLEQAFDVLVVDDNSPDGTADLVEQVKQRYPTRIHLMRRAGKLGLGTAYLDGFRWGLKNAGYRYFFEMDCDFSHNPKDLMRLREILVRNEGDVVVGSRYVRGGRVENWPAGRIALSYGASLYVRCITWMPVKDPTAGFVGYKREVLEKLDMRKIRFIGYAFQIEMKFAARQMGFSIREIPITFTDRVEGSSKMSKSIVREAIRGVLQMRWRSFWERYG